MRSVEVPLLLKQNHESEDSNIKDNPIDIIHIDFNNMNEAVNVLILRRM